jgi:hypothetical protein
MSNTILALAAPAAAIAGVVIGWFLNRLNDSRRWTREDKFRWHQAKMAAYMRYLSATGEVYQLAGKLSNCRHTVKSDDDRQKCQAIRTQLVDANQRLGACYNEMLVLGDADVASAAVLLWDLSWQVMDLADNSEEDAYAFSRGPQWKATDKVWGQARKELVVAIKSELDLLPREQKESMRALEAELQATDTDEFAISGHVQSDATTSPEENPPQALVVLSWYPKREFQQALERWPEMKDRWETDSYPEYTAMVQRFLMEAAAQGLNPKIAPIEVAGFANWCEETKKDPLSPLAGADYAAKVAQTIGVVYWPPPPYAACWCGSSAPYNECCGTVSVDH